MTTDAAPTSAVRKVVLGAEIARSYASARWQLRRQDLRTVVDYVRPPGTRSAPMPLDEARRLARAVVRTLALLPADSRCLIRSLVVLAVLAHRGANASLVIGVRAGDDFGAHAWVELEGQPLLAPREDQYARLVEL